MSLTYEVCSWRVHSSPRSNRLCFLFCLINGSDFLSLIIILPSSLRNRTKSGFFPLAFQSSEGLLSFVECYVARKPPVSKIVKLAYIVAVDYNSFLELSFYVYVHVFFSIKSLIFILILLVRRFS